ncbi:hypothetical protein [Paenibacillus donghaensis]|uniref:Uncharacterized protein n=1 Tax=Paenibacillus donghaensis TaxID=414771 RepID=A0A2Z2K5C4_9BACL|nr:hypothetical protein [Paenibacillus donghaensis]ASA19704.1 hypothetical protein B9T62_02080 [Paenibacillus donghaensis]
MINKERYRQVTIQSNVVMILFLAILASILSVQWSRWMELALVAVGVAWLVVTMKRPFHRETVIRNSWISLLAIILVGHVIGGGMGMANITGYIESLLPPEAGFFVVLAFGSAVNGL